MRTKILHPEVLHQIDLYWKAANYLTVGQIYLQENPLLQEPLKSEHIKPRLLGHWGTSPGLSFIYAHLNRLIKENDANIIYLAGPGHGGPAIVANTYLEGTYSEIYPNVSQDTDGIRQLFRQFSTPGGIPSHVSVTSPGSIHEGGELGYVLVHAFGAVFDNPDLIVAAIVGDGEAETGPLEGSWKNINFLNPVSDGAVLPIRHLNGYKIAGPTVLGRERDENIQNLLGGHGYEVHWVEGVEEMAMHRDFADALDICYDKIKTIQHEARTKGFSDRPNWPVIVFRSPKGWTGPKALNGRPVEGTFRAHQVPLPNVKDDSVQLSILEQWMQSYHPKDLFDDHGRLVPELAELAPKGDLRMGANPNANGGKLAKDLDLPDFTKYEVQVKQPGITKHESTKQLGQFMRDIFQRNKEQKNFRLFCPDETNSNRLGDVFEVENREWREPISSLNILLTSTCWRNDHNGFSHQGPGLIDTVLAMKGTVVRIYLPPDANSLLSVADHCFRSKNYVNLIVIDKQPEMQWLDMHAALRHCTDGVSIWEWAGNNQGGEPEVILASAGDTPTLEILAASWLLKKYLPGLKVRVVNVVDLMCLFPEKVHPHGLKENRFVELFTAAKPVIFGFHGYRRAMHHILHGRTNAERFHVRGFIDDGTTTTPFDMVVRNKMSRFHICIEAIRRSNYQEGASFQEYCKEILVKHQAYTTIHFEDLPEVSNWNWSEL